MQETKVTMDQATHEVEEGDAFDLGDLIRVFRMASRDYLEAVKTSELCVRYNKHPSETDV